MPSTKMSLRASKPRMKKRSPKALPPSRCRGDARGGARHVLEAGGVLVLEDFLGEDGDAFGRIGDRLGEFRRGEAVRLVWRRGVRIGIAVGGRSVGGGRLGLRLGLRGLLGARGPAQRGTDAQLLRRWLRRRRRLRSTGASTLTGGSVCSSAMAPPIDAIAIRQPMVTFRDASVSSVVLMRPLSINDRSDRGAVTVVIFAPRFPFPSPRCRVARGVTRKPNSGETKKNQTKVQYFQYYILYSF